MDLLRARHCHITEKMEVEDGVALWRLLVARQWQCEMAATFSMPPKSVPALFSSEAGLGKLQ